VKRLILLCVSLLVWMSGAVAAQGQDRGASSPRVDSAAVVSGVGFASPGRWAQLRNTVINPTDQPQNVILLNSLGKSTNLQYAQSVWLPPKSQRVVDVLVRMNPDETIPSRQGLPIQTMLLQDTAGGTERGWLSRYAGQVIVEQGTAVSLLGLGDDAMYDVLGKMRSANDGGKGLRSVRTDSLPRTPQAWEGQRVLAIVDSLPDMDPQAMRALQGWLYSGGSIWIMLDRVSESFIQNLLGDNWQVTVIDEVELSRVVFGRTRQAGDTYEKPVKLVRTLPNGAQVLSQVGDWPAAMSIPVGQGQVVVTTLEARAWLTKQASDPIGDVGNALMRRAPYDEPVVTAAASLAAQSVGRQIVNRSVVLLVLAVMTLAILVIGLLLHRQGRLEWMGIIGPAMAVVAAVVLLVVGQKQQGQVPLTIASMQHVTVVPGTSHATVRGAAAVYSPDTHAGPLQITRGGSFWPDMTNLEGKVVRLLQTDLDQWQWQNVEFSSGVIRTGSYHQTIYLNQPVYAYGQFGPQGVTIETSLGQLGRPEDALIVSRNGGVWLESAPADQAGSGDAASSSVKLYATPAMTLSHGEYLRSGNHVIADVQTRRQLFFKQAFDRSTLPAEPALMAWTHQPGTGLTLSGDPEARDTALVTVPIQWRPVPAGTRVVIPSAFLEIEQVRGMGQMSGASLYTQEGTWLESNNSTRMTLAVNVPESVLPFKADKAELLLSIRAPGRKVEVRATHRPNGELLASFDSPSMGVNRIDVTSLAQNITAQKNRIELVIEVSDATGNEQPWKINSLQMELSGQVLEAAGAKSASTDTAVNR